MLIGRSTGANALPQDVVVLEGVVREDRNMTISPPLPLSQQILAWILRAMGYAESLQGAISPGTLKNARRGVPILRSWDGLANRLFDLLGASPDPERRAEIRKFLRSFDDRISALPPLADLSLEQRLHMPLSLCIHTVGLRLGALAACKASTTNTPIEEWLWLVEPFDRRFFGRLVSYLVELKLPQASTEQKKALLAPAVEWRTFERWKSGEVSVPNASELELLEECLGADAEMILRAARMAVVFREDLSGWFGEERTHTWMSSVAQVARVSAMLLSRREHVDSLLRWYCDDLRGAKGQVLHAQMKPFLSRSLRDLSPSELACVFAAEAVSLEGTAMGSHEVRDWAIGVMVLVPDFRTTMLVYSLLGNPMRSVVSHADQISLIREHWKLLGLLNGVSAGSSEPIRRADGEVLHLSRGARAAAGRLLKKLSAFPSEIDLSAEQDFRRIVIEMFGCAGVAEMERLEDAPSRLMSRMLDAKLEEALPDAIVAANRHFCYSRARRLAESGDQSGALHWFARARDMGGSWTDGEINDALCMLAALAHYALDLMRVLRESRRANPCGSSATEVRDGILNGVGVAEQLVEQIMRGGNAPSGSHMSLATLVVVIPLVIRCSLLREEIEEADVEVPLSKVKPLVEELETCLQRHPTHGRAWAVRALAEWVERDEIPASMERTVIHYGAAAFLDSEMRRIEADFGPPREA
jgi:hypothetical protein